jgi:hypothetical protein
MRRRDFMALVGSATSAIAGIPSRSVAAQRPSRVPRIGVLGLGSPVVGGILGLLQGLTELGYSRGDVHIDYRNPPGSGAPPPTGARSRPRVLGGAVAVAR